MEKKELRKFAITLTIVTIVLGALWMRKGTERLHFVFFGIAGYSALSAIFCPTAIKPVYMLLTGIGHVVSSVITTLVLGFVFYFVLTPIGLLFKILGKDLLNVKVKSDTETHWIPKEKKDIGPKGYENQF